MNVNCSPFNLSSLISSLADNFHSYLEHFFICHPGEILTHQWRFWNAGALQCSKVNNDTFLSYGFNTFPATTRNLICSPYSMTWNPSAFSFVQKLILPAGLIRSMLQSLMSCARFMPESILEIWTVSWEREGSNLEFFSCSSSKYPIYLTKAYFVLLCVSNC